MKVHTSIVSTLATLFAASLLSGCINTPQTKALITPIGAVGVHSFAPPREAPNNAEFQQRMAQRPDRTSSEAASNIAERS